MIGDLSNHLWWSTLFAALAGLFARALRRHEAHVRYWVWFAASCKFLVPFAVLAAVGKQLAQTFGLQASSVLVRAGGTLRIERIAQSLSDGPSRAATFQLDAGWAFVPVAVWACGSFAVAASRWRSRRRIQAAVRTSTPLRADLVPTFIRDSVTGKLQVRSCPGLMEPAIVGIRRPILLMPEGLPEHLTTPQLQAIVAHESCHVRRRDNLTAAMHMAVEGLFWFHPLVWWIGARLVDERERACDEYVLRMIGQPRVYAESILAVCKACLESPLACAAGVTGSRVRQRIEDIMSNRIGIRLSTPWRLTLALAAALAVAVPTGAGMMSRVGAQSRMRTADPLALIAKKETVLKYELFEMRDAIDRHHADKGTYPSTLGALVTAHYITQIPADPFTNRTDSWRIVLQEPGDSVGVYDVKSGSDTLAIDGTKYSDW